jgi:hypothetical protein
MDITASGAVSAILHLHFRGNNVRRLSRDIELHALDGQIPERILVSETSNQKSREQGHPNVECYTFQLFSPLGLSGKLSSRRQFSGYRHYPVLD